MKYDVSLAILTVFGVYKGMGTMLRPGERLPWQISCLPVLVKGVRKSVGNANYFEKIENKKVRIPDLNGQKTRTFCE